MIYYDQIVNEINGTGGIGVLFSEIYQRLRRDNISFHKIEYSDCDANVVRKKRVLERYRDVPLENIATNKAVFHSTYYRLPAQRNIATVTTVHDFTYERILGGLPKFVHSIQKKRAILASDSIICVSQNTVNDLLYYVPQVDESRIKLVHNGVSQSYFRLDSDNVNRNENVLFVGARGKYKNFKSLVLALAKLSDYRLLCVGGGLFTPDEKDFLSTHLAGRFAHAGYVSQEYLNRLYNEAHCLVYPSLYEGFGIPILEAYRSGCPVVAVNCSSIPEVAGDAAILLDNGCSEEIAEAIQCFQSDAGRMTYINRGLSQVQKFSWEKTYSKTVAVYNSI